MGAHLPTAGSKPPESAGIYHIELNGQIYTGSGVNVRARLSSSDHPAAKLLADPNVKVTVIPSEARFGRWRPADERARVARFRAGRDGLKQNTPRQTGPPQSLNDIRAAKPERVGEYKQDAADNNASRGRGKAY